MTALFFEGNALSVLPGFPADYFHTVVTSPPFFGLRAYDSGQEMWPDGWEGQLGAEPTPDLYIQHLILIMRGIRRVLRPDGVFWLNIADSYCSTAPGTMGDSLRQSGILSGVKEATAQARRKYRPRTPDGLKPLDMMLIPSLLALAAREDGWYVRSMAIWAKGVSFSDEYNGNPMPECLDPSTLVFVRTLDGWMRRVSLGDLSKMGEPYPEILSPTGWVKIQKLWKTEKPAMTLQVGKVERVICSPDHRFPVSHDRRRLATELKEAGSIRFKGYSDYLLYRPIQQFCATKVSSWGRFNLGYDIGFVLGIYVAEGSQDGRFGNGIQISLGGHEAKLRARIARILSSVGIEIHPETGDGRECVFRVYDESLFRFIDSFVSGQAKTKRLTVDLLLNTPEVFRQGVLDGYIAGDGSDRPAGGWSAASASVRLRDDISTLASSLGVITSKGRQQSISAIAPNLSVGHTLWTPYVDRNGKVGQDGTFCIPVRGRTPSKQRAAMRTMIDLEVDGGLFLIGDGLITHNSVNGWRWEKHKVKVGNNGRGREPARNTTEGRPQQDHDGREFQPDTQWDNCPGCPKCSTNDGYVLRKGSWRPTDSHEFVLMLTKTESYFCDREAVLEPNSSPEQLGHNLRYAKPYAAFDERAAKTGQPGNVNSVGKHARPGNGGRNIRSVWMFPTAPGKFKHYAAFPPRLPEICIQAATSEKGCCPKCGAPWARVVAKGLTDHDGGTQTDYPVGSTANRLALLRQAARERGEEYSNVTRTVGWRATCSCPPADPIPCRVLDPFSGAGTTAMVAERLGRDSFNIDTSAEYIALSEERLADDEDKRVTAELKQIMRDAGVRTRRKAK